MYFSYQYLCSYLLYQGAKIVLFVKLNNFFEMAKVPGIRFPKMIMRNFADEY